MLKPLKKIGIISLIILILPISAFFIYQFASLNESENEINKIYLQQLETIIYSINQYSNDVVTSWSNEINFILSNNGGEYQRELQRFMSENSSIKSVFLSDTNFVQTSKFYSPLLQKDSDIDKSDHIVIIDSVLIKRLVKYLDVGYKKIESLGKLENKNTNLCIFINEQDSANIQICGIIFNPDEFVQNHLTSKITQACGDEFILSVMNQENKEVVFSCEKMDLEELILEKPLWLIPEFSIGIKMRAGNIGDLVSQRYKKNLLILGLLFLVLIIGIGIISQNLKRQLKLTQLKSDFISNVSHELRTPLSLISMYSETLMLNRIKTEEKKKEYYSVINNETNRLTKIVNSILNFSKMESGTREYNFAAVNLAELNEEILKTYDYHIKSKGFNYSVKKENIIDNMLGDKDAISESIINLVENAIKYSQQRKEFIITIGQNNIGPFLEIQDFGIGIHADDQNKIFDKFYRVSSGLVHNTKGTGLGLALVKQIIEAHNGEIVVKSEIGNGSIFKLQFDRTFNH